MLTGIIWTEHFELINHPPEQSIQGAECIAWSPDLGLFAAISANVNDPVAWRSSDGLNWSSASFPSTVGSWGRLIWVSELDLFVATSFGDGTQTGLIATSPDAINWTIRNLPSALPDGFWGLNALAWSPSLVLLCAIANNFSGSDDEELPVFTSPDGVTWTQRDTSGLNNPGGGIFIERCRDLKWIGSLGLFVASVQATNSSLFSGAATSSDGVNWSLSQIIPSPPTLPRPGPVMFSEDSDLAIILDEFSGGLGTSSPDADDWSTPFAVPDRYFDADWVPSLGSLVAVGWEGTDRLTSAISVDGETWAAQPVPSTQGSPQYQRFAYSPTLNIFVAVDRANGSIAIGAPDTPPAPAGCPEATIVGCPDVPLQCPDLGPCDLCLTVFEPDGVTPAWSVSTSAADARPYLVDPIETGGHYGEQEVDFTEGRTSIGEIVVRVVDPPDPAGSGQAQGWLTARLADDGGFSALRSRRARLIRATEDAQSTVVIVDGPVSTIRQSDSYAAYDFSIRDTRESERKTRAFDNTEFLGTTLVFPFGIRLPWGDSESTGVAWAISGQIGTLANVTTLDGVRFASFEGLYTNFTGTGNCDNQTDDITLYIRDEVGWLAHSTPEQIAPGLYRHTWPNCQMQWRLASGGDWQDVTLEEVNSSLDSINLFAFVCGDVEYADLATLALVTQEDVRLARGIYIRGTPLPDLSENIFIRIVYRGPVSETFPYHFDGPAGEFLTCLYAGAFSREGSPPIRFDPAAVQQITNPILLRITEPIEDVREWAEENIYKPFGWAPVLNSNGCISPRRHGLIPGQVITTVVTDLNAAPSPSWTHDDTTVNVVRVTYGRVFAFTGGNYGFQPFRDDFANDGILVTSETTIERREPGSINVFGEQEWDSESPALFAQWRGNNSGPLLPVEEEVGFQVAEQRAQVLFPRYAFGTPVITLRVVRGDVADLLAGDYVNVDISWMPDYVTRERGLTSMAQIISIRDLNCSWRELMLELTEPAEAVLITGQGGMGFGGESELEEES